MERKRDHSRVIENTGMAGHLSDERPDVPVHQEQARLRELALRSGPVA